MRVLSLGAGVQSTTVLLMSMAGELLQLDHAIFADTGWEPSTVYEHLAWLESVTTVPIHRVSAGNIRDDALNPESRFASMPLFVATTTKVRVLGTGTPCFKCDGSGTVIEGRSPDDDPEDEGDDLVLCKDCDGLGWFGAEYVPGPPKRGMIRRQCTKEYKIEPIQAKLRELLKEAGEASAEHWFGISLDEVQRMRDSRVKYLHNVYPLVDARMTRQDCYRWLEAHGYPTPPKSACIGCPFHGDDQWRALRDQSPTEWDDAVSFDAAIRGGNTSRHKAEMRGQVFLHSSLKPLPMVDLSTPEDHGQGDLFGNECEGMCGV